jgi:glutaredoxin
MAKDFFAKYNLIYADKDISVDEEVRNEAIKKSGQLITPVIDIDGIIIAGFNEPKLRELLEIKD